MYRLFALVVLMGWTNHAFASNYPPYYSHQTVRVLHHDPVLFAEVASGFMAKYVVGYKNSGYLTQSHPNKISALLITSCGDGRDSQKTTTIDLGQEWNQSGYMSTALDLYYHLSRECQLQSNWTLEVALLDSDGHWDSLYGQNYGFTLNGLRGPRARVFETHQTGKFGGIELNDLAWKFIVNEMRQSR
jgi:hypothetical protein